MLYFVLPAYNEGNGAGLQINSLRNFATGRNLDYKIIVVNDGSSDETLREIEKFKDSVKLQVINHKVNRGPGAAFKSGFDYLRPFLKNEDIVVTMDCDNTQHINTLKLMLSKVNEGYDVVLGSIFIMGGKIIGVPLGRIIMTYCVSLLYRMLFPMKGIKNYTAFYRAVPGSALKAAYERFGSCFVETNGFGCMAEMLIKFRQIPLFITEVPMIVRYDLKISRSKIKIIKTIKEHLMIIGNNLFKKHLL